MADSIVSAFHTLSDEVSSRKLKDFVSRLDAETKSYVSKAAAQTVESIISNSSVRAAGLTVIKGLKQ